MIIGNGDGRGKVWAEGNRWAWLADVPAALLTGLLSSVEVSGYATTPEDARRAVLAALSRLEAVSEVRLRHLREENAALTVGLAQHGPGWRPWRRRRPAGGRRSIGGGCGRGE